MLKRASVLLAICFCFVVFSGITQAQGQSVEGAWDVYGKAKISAVFPGIVSLKLSLLDLGILNEVFVFEQGGTFHDSLTSGTSLGMYGTWTQNGAAVTLNLDAWVADIQTELQNLLGNLAVVNVTNKSFGGKLGKGGWKGKVLVSFTVTPAGIPSVLTVIISGSLVGVPTTMGVAAAEVPIMMSPEEKVAKTARFIKDTFLFPLNLIK